VGDSAAVASGDFLHSVLEEEFLLFQTLFLELFVLGKARLAGESLEPKLMVAVGFEQATVFRVDLRQVLRVGLVHRSILLKLLNWVREDGRVTTEV
jgi:hypothetical protein